MDLTTTYLGLELRNPLVAAPSPLQQTPGGVITLVDAGVGAVVLHSIFEEQVRAESDPDFAPNQWFTNPAGPGAPARYLELVEQSVKAVDVPVIASMNGTSTSGDWVCFAEKLQEAGAAALEINFYVVPGQFRGHGEVLEDAVVDLLSAVHACTSIPVAVKLPPYFSSLNDVAVRLVERGAAGLVMFNRFLQPRIDVSTLQVEPVIDLSHSSDARLPQTWIAVLREQLECSLAGTGGVETAADVAAYLLAGADVVQCASAFMRHGRDYATRLLEDLEAWGDEAGFASVGEFRGKLAVPWQVDSREYQRDGYVSALQVARRAYVWK
ncbi:MAG: dihydroorotate dehydrogenase-like protein [Nocardioidaceae bacterium]|nr:dihydroorotate dehydrogenase-like protein [Nocardioidaceae bacterium]